EEAVLSIQGIVWQKDLPPFYKERYFEVILRAHTLTEDSLHKNQIRYLKQSISLTGFDTLAFHTAVDNLSSIYALFSHCVLPTKLQAWVLDDYTLGFCSISASNRLFTPRSESPTDPIQDLGRDVDPQGKLLKCTQLGGQYFHSKDNKVNYWEWTTNQLGTYKYIPTSPTKIQVRDIIEVKLFFLAVPLRGSQFKMTVVLHDLTILDGKFAHQNAITAWASDRVQLVKPAASLKRQTGYEDEQEAEARTKLSQMEIDERNSRGGQGDNNCVAVVTCNS
ncbi:hypothetical protein L208DRAFT_1246044, partial [Tricholoma matsutake]